MLERIFGANMDEVTKEWRKLRNEEYFSGDKIEKNEMGGACSTYGGEEMRIQCVGGGNLRERGHLGDPGPDGRII